MLIEEEKYKIVGNKYKFLIGQPEMGKGERERNR